MAWAFVLPLFGWASHVAAEFSHSIDVATNYWSTGKIPESSSNATRGSCVSTEPHMLLLVTGLIHIRDASGKRRSPIGGGLATAAPPSLRPLPPLSKMCSESSSSQNVIVKQHEIAATQTKEKNATIRFVFKTIRRHMFFVHSHAWQ